MNLEQQKQRFVSALEEKFPGVDTQEPVSMMMTCFCPPCEEPGAFDALKEKFKKDPTHGENIDAYIRLWNNSAS